MAGILGGLQSLHTDAFDEVMSVPTERAARIAVSTQNILKEEAHLTDVADALGGSYYVEALTNRIEAEVFAILARVDAMGGTVRAIEEGFFQREIADAAYAFARRKAAGEQVVVGVNRYAEPPEAAPRLAIHTVGPDVEPRQVARVRAVRAGRDGTRVAALLERLAREARDPAVNLMPVTLELVKARATLGEIVARLRDVFGSYVERPVF
jgi:methylmalonyl-CoA mutase N-terminal domain/subunit